MLKCLKDVAVLGSIYTVAFKLHVFLQGSDSRVGVNVPADVFKTVQIILALYGDICGYLKRSDNLDFVLSSVAVRI